MRNGGKAGTLTPPGPLSEEAKAIVKHALQEMVNSVPFRTSRQCQDLLRYMVLHSLSGEEELLRERIIGVNVFGRSPDYDQAADPVVRIRAADVRKRIALYYESTDVATRHLKIAVPSGSYRAYFEFIGSEKHLLDRQSTEIVAPLLAESHAISPSAVIIPSAQPAKGRAWLARRRTLALLTTAVLLLSIAYAFIQPARQTAFERFWSPVLSNPNKSLIYLGSNAVYSLSAPFLEKYRQQHSLDKLETMGREILVPLSPSDTLTGNDLIPIRDTFVTIGDAAATARIASFLSQRKKAYDMRFGGDISVGDLRERPAILVGGFNNSWTLEMTDSLRFVFAYQFQIQDRFERRNSWRANPNFSEDYAIISRILNSKTGEILITAAGLGQAGTRAAGEFLTSPEAVDAVMLKAPRGWEKKNMQIVLHTTVINNSPGQSEVVATYFW